MPKSNSLQLHEDLGFQRREWRAQRLGSWALTLFVVAAAAGLFGSGPLSRVRATTPDGSLSVEYERFVRRGAGLRLVVHHDAPASGAVELRLDRAYVDGLRIERVTPEPETIDVGATDVVFTFSTSSATALAIIIDAEPLHAGRLSAQVRTSAGQPLQLSQLVYF